MMKKRKQLAFLVLLLLFLVPVSYFTFNKYINFDTLSAGIFLIIVALLVLKYRKSLDFQVINMPFLYIVLYRTKFGIKFIEKVSAKFKEFIKFLGYCIIGFAFLGMIWVSVSIFLGLVLPLLFSPREAVQSVGLVLPLTNVPGLGYLSFWHFLLTIFITVLIHEFAHGIVARAHDIPVKSSGLGALSVLVPIFPLAFVEPDENRMKKKSDVVQYSVFAAGPMANVALAIILLFIMPYVGYGVVHRSTALAPFEGKLTEPSGISFSGMQEGFPAEKAGLEPGVVITGVDDTNLEDYNDFIDYLESTKPGQEIVLHSASESYNVVLTSHPENKSTYGYLGVLGVANEREVKQEYSSFSGPYYWLKGLFRWLFIINFLIGLINLLPLIITDGGRMMKTAFERIFSDSQKADKAWAFIGGIFFIAIMIALALRYIIFPILSLVGIG